MILSLRQFTIGLSLVLSASVFPLLSQATTVAGSSLVRLDSDTTGSTLGRSQAVGDINGDGYDDLVIGANSSGSTVVGRVEIIYGQANNISAMTLSSSNVTVLTGASIGDQAGDGVAVGNLNNDAYDDILVGASRDDQTLVDGGTVYVIYGQASPIASGALSTYPRFLPEAADDRLGGAIAIGDINGDGTDEIVIGAQKNDDGASNAGAVYIYWNNGATVTSNVSLSNVTESYGETSNNTFGVALLFEDINNDGYDDIIASASGYNSSVGAVYVVYGSASATNTGTAGNGSIALSGVRLTTGSSADGMNSITAGDINGDGYSELAIGAASNDTAAANAGIVYLLYGSATNFTTSSIASAITFTGENTTDNLGTALKIADLNNDGYAELMMEANNNNDGGLASGTVYLYTGSGTTITSGSVTAANHEFTGTFTGESFGRSIATPDLNGDGFAELTFGEPTYNNAGAISVAYLTVNADGDDVAAATGGLLYTGTDCSDTDATVSANQTYYADTDADTLGDPLVTTSVCASTAPTGYVANSTDTNDTIPNNGVEISGDSIDNDGDSLIDEVNTVAENGVHPFYSTQDPTDTTAVATNILSVTGIANGMIEVTYADNSVYDYFVYTPTTKTTNVEQYEDTGYGIVLHKKGKQVYLINLYNGDKTDQVTIKKAGFTASAMLLKDLRSNHKSEVVVTGKTKAKVTLAIVKVNSTNGTLTKSDSEKITNKHVSVTKTRATSTKIQLRSSKSKVLETFTVTKTYTLKLV